MIFVTGDCHGEFKRFSYENFPEQRNMSREDIVVICGDFGGILCPNNPEQYANQLSDEEYWLDWLEDRPYTTVFVAGNHENYDRLNDLPEQEWNGGKVHEIRPHVLYLMNGEIFTVSGVKIFAFGGARSHDISDGLLDSRDPAWRAQAMELIDSGKRQFRVRGITWWDAEMPSMAEMKHGMENLAKNNWRVDYVFSHCCSTHLQNILAGDVYAANELTDYFEQLSYSLDYNFWFFGHYHGNKKVTQKDILLYEQIIRIL